jgi:hypothetical protein
MKTVLLKIVIFNSIALFTLTARGQKIQKMKLTDAEVPAGYKASPKMLCKSVQAASFYEQTDIYENMLGTVKNKEYQSFESKGDKGTILYLEYEEDFAGEAFFSRTALGRRQQTDQSASGRILD